MYENIPFWFTFLDSLGYEVVYSDRSNKAIYELGQETIPSDTICYPAKLVHGHIENLLRKMNTGQSFVCPKERVATLRKVIKDITALGTDCSHMIFTNTKMTSKDWRCHRMQ